MCWRSIAFVTLLSLPFVGCASTQKNVIACPEKGGAAWRELLGRHNLYRLRSGLLSECARCNELYGVQPWLFSKRARRDELHRVCSGIVPGRTGRDELHGLQPRLFPGRDRRDELRGV